VLAVGELWLSKIRPTGLAAALIGVLPVSAPGTGRSVSEPCPGLGEGTALPDEDAFADLVLERKMLMKVGARGLAELTTKRSTGGRFGVFNSCRERMPILMTWFDTEQGRYFMVHDNSRLNVGPG